MAPLEDVEQGQDIVDLPASMEGESVKVERTENDVDSKMGTDSQTETISEEGSCGDNRDRREDKSSAETEKLHKSQERSNEVKQDAAVDVAEVENVEAINMNVETDNYNIPENANIVEENSSVDSAVLSIDLPSKDDNKKDEVKPDAAVDVAEVENVEAIDMNVETDNQNVQEDANIVEENSSVEPAVLSIDLPSKDDNKKNEVKQDAAEADNIDAIDMNVETDNQNVPEDANIVEENSSVDSAVLSIDLPSKDDNKKDEVKPDAVEADNIDAIDMNVETDNQNVQEDANIVEENSSVDSAVLSIDPPSKDDNKKYEVKQDVAEVENADAIDMNVETDNQNVLEDANIVEENSSVDSAVLSIDPPSKDDNKKDEVKRDVAEVENVDAIDMNVETDNQNVLEDANIVEENSSVDSAVLSIDPPSKDNNKEEDNTNKNEQDVDVDETDHVAMREIQLDADVDMNDARDTFEHVRPVEEDVKVESPALSIDEQSKDNDEDGENTNQNEEDAEETDQGAYEESDSDEVSVDEDNDSDDDGYALLALTKKRLAEQAAVEEAKAAQLPVPAIQAEEPVCHQEEEDDQQKTETGLANEVVENEKDEEEVESTETPTSADMELLNQKEKNNVSLTNSNDTGNEIDEIKLIPKDLLDSEEEQSDEEEDDSDEEEKVQNQTPTVKIEGRREENAELWALLQASKTRLGAKAAVIDADELQSRQKIKSNSSPLNQLSEAAALGSKSQAELLSEVAGKKDQATLLKEMAERKKEKYKKNKKDSSLSFSIGMNIMNTKNTTFNPQLQRQREFDEEKAQLYALLSQSKKRLEEGTAASTLVSAQTGGINKNQESGAHPQVSQTKKKTGKGLFAKLSSYGTPKNSHDSSNSGVKENHFEHIDDIPEKELTDKELLNQKEMLVAMALAEEAANSGQEKFNTDTLRRALDSFSFSKQIKNSPLRPSTRNIGANGSVLKVIGKMKSKLTEVKERIEVIDERSRCEAIQKLRVDTEMLCEC